MDHDELLDALEERLGSRESAVAGLNGFVDAVMRGVAAGGRSVTGKLRMLGRYAGWLPPVGRS